MSNDGSDAPKAFNWGITPRDPAIVAAEQEAAAAAAAAAAAEAQAAAQAAGQPAATPPSTPEPSYFSRPPQNFAQTPPAQTPLAQTPPQQYQAPQYQAPQNPPVQDAAPQSPEPADDPFAIFATPPTVQAPIIPDPTPSAAPAEAHTETPAPFPWESLPGPSSAAAPVEQPAPAFPWETPSAAAPPPAAPTAATPPAASAPPLPWETAAAAVPATPPAPAAPAFPWETPVASAPAEPAATAFPWESAPAPAAAQQQDPETFSWDTPTVANPVAPSEPAAWDQPTVATPYVEMPTEAYSVTPEPQTYPWDNHEPIVIAPDNAETELFAAQPSAPEGTAASSDPIDALFSDTNFVEYEDEPLLTQIPFAGKSDAPVAPTAPRAPHAPLTSTQKTLLWVAGGLVAALILVGVFLVGTKLAVPATSAPEPAATTPTEELPEDETPVVTGELGPVEPGVYPWNALLGTECLEPFTSVWDEEFTVIDCSDEHTAQVTAVGEFDDEAGAAYPETEEFGTRIDELCTGKAVINFAKAKKYDDIQVSASYPATQEIWDAGSRTYYCFATRESGDTLKGTIAVKPKADAAETE